MFCLFFFIFRLRDLNSLGEAEYNKISLHCKAMQVSPLGPNKQSNFYCSAYFFIFRLRDLNSLGEAEYNKISLHRKAMQVSPLGPNNRRNFGSCGYFLFLTTPCPRDLNDSSHFRRFALAEPKGIYNKILCLALGPKNSTFVDTKKSSFYGGEDFSIR